MKFAIGVTSKKETARIAPRLGLTPVFRIIDSDFPGAEIEFITGADASGQQTWRHMAELFIRHQISVVITGMAGPGMLKGLSALHIHVIDGVSGTLDEAMTSLPRFEAQAAAFINSPDSALFFDGKGHLGRRGMGGGILNIAGPSGRGNGMRCRRGAGMGQRSGNRF